MDHGLIENIPAIHICPVLLCEDVPQLCLPCKLHRNNPVRSTHPLLQDFDFVLKYKMEHFFTCCPQQLRISICSCKQSKRFVFHVSIIKNVSLFPQFGGIWQLDAVALLKEMLLNRTVDIDIKVGLHTGPAVEASRLSSCGIFFNWQGTRVYTLANSKAMAGKLGICATKLVRVGVFTRLVSFCQEARTTAL